jgi:hypothetical protein
MLQERGCGMARKNSNYFLPAVKKPQFLSMVKLARAGNLCLVDNVIKENGHDALHLPPLHPNLNYIYIYCLFGET